MNSERYIRQERLPGFGKPAQEKLGKSAVLVVGLGGLGIPVVQYLNAMGIGTLGMVDHDVVSLSNLHRQVLYKAADVGSPKVDAARAFLKAQNPHTTLKTYNSYLDHHLARDLFTDYDVIVDASDNFDTRYTINDTCVKLDKPMVYGALHGYEGQLTVFNYKGGPTYRCLYPEPPESGEIPNCEEHGVLGVLPGIVGTLQALEAVKICVGIGEVCSGKMVLFNGLNMSFYDFNFQRRPAAVEKALKGEAVTAEAISSGALLAKHQGSPQQIIDVRTAAEYRQFHLPGAVNLELGQLEDSLGEINPDLPVYLICESGARSKKAQQLLQEKLPTARLVNVAGGMAQIRALCS